MKKILSIVLALAVVVSCFTAVYALPSLADPTFGAVFNVANTGEAKCAMSSKRVAGTTINTTEMTPFKDINFGTHASRTFKIAVYNGTSTDVKVFPSWGWGYRYTRDLTVTGEGETQKATTTKVYSAEATAELVKAGECKIIDMVVPSGVYWANNDNKNDLDIKNGSNGEKVDGSGIGIRFNFTTANVANAGKIYMSCVKSDGVTEAEVNKINDNLYKLEGLNSLSVLADWNADASTVALKALIDSGIQNYTSFGVNGGKVELVDGGANGTPKAVKFSGATGKYASIGYLVGGTVINDTTNNYNGGGAGKYKLTFYAKAEAGKGGKFNVGIDTINNGRNNDSWMQGKAVTLTDEWQKFEVTVEVTEANLANVAKIFAERGFDAYQLILRLDGATAGGAFESETFAYFLDEVSIEKVVDTPAGGEGEGAGGGEESATPTPTPTPKVPTGVKIEYTEDFTGLNYIISAKGVFTDADVKDGELTKTYKVTNNGDDTLKLKLRFQLVHTKADGGQTWAGPTDGTFVEIEPGETAELTYTAEVEDGKVTVGDTEYPIANLFVRLEIGADGNVEVLKGTSFTVYCGQTVAEALTKGSKGMKNATVELVYDEINAPKKDGDVLPVAFIALVAVATVALVVVSKKKREEF